MKIDRWFPAVPAAAAAACAALAAQIGFAKPMQVSGNGLGQVLIFPYYTVNGDANSLLSVVNTTSQGKVVRLNFREARGGVIVASVNVYLSTRDVWTATIVRDASGVARLRTGDQSCTSPAISREEGLAFSRDGYIGDVVNGIERAYEGLVEVIELATIPLSTEADPASLQADITHIPASAASQYRRIPPCLVVGANDYEPRPTELTAPSGGLRGTLSIIAPSALGTVAVTPTTAIENFWTTNPSPTALFAPPTQTVDLASGGNQWASVSATLAREYVDRLDNALRNERASERFNPVALWVRFDRSIDAVSALLMASSSQTEYAYTADNTVAATMLFATPTKAYLPRTSAMEPFATWNPTASNACDRVRDPSASSTDRETGFSSGRAGFPVMPPVSPYALCYVASAIISNLPFDGTLLAAPNWLRMFGYQNAGFAVPAVGQEGGWGSFSWAHSSESASPTLRTLTPREALVEASSSASPTWRPVRVQLVGLPVIGFAVQQYRLISAQQTPIMNFAFAVPLTSRLTAIELD